MLTVDDFPDFLFRKEHSTLEGPRMIRVVTEFLYTVPASVRGIFGRIFCHVAARKSCCFKRVFFIDFFIRTSGWNSPQGLALTRAHNLLMKNNDCAGIP